MLATQPQIGGARAVAAEANIALRAMPVTIAGCPSLQLNAIVGATVQKGAKQGDS